MSKSKTQAQPTPLIEGSKSLEVKQKHKQDHQFMVPKVEKQDTSTTKTTRSRCQKLRSMIQAQLCYGPES